MTPRVWDPECERDGATVNALWEVNKAAASKLDILGQLGLHAKAVGAVGVAAEQGRGAGSRGVFGFG